MPRTLRAIAGGHCYHVINRSNSGEEIFHSRDCYSRFLSLIAEAQERLWVPLLAACLMPNHVHFVMRPLLDADLSAWMHWVFTTQVRRYHAKWGTRGRLWQGRFKAFVIQEDTHLLTVLRYVERNALRAGLVDRAEDWPWGSLQWRMSEHGLTLAPSPLELPANWIDYVNEPQTTAELAALRTCVNRQSAFGDQAWVEASARTPELAPSMVHVGKPASPSLVAEP